MFSLTTRYLVITFAVFSFSAFGAPVFDIFPSWEDAREVYLAKYEPLLSSLEGREAYSVIDHDDVRYIKIEEMTEILFEAYMSLYSDQLSTKSPPYILILDSDVMNAAALNGLFEEEKPYIFLVHKNMLDLDYNSLIGVIAHELAHLLLQWEENEVDYPEIKHYVAVEGELFFGENIKKNIELKENVKNYIEAHEDYGPFDNIELGGIPLHYDQSEPSDLRVLQYMLRKASNSFECVKARKLYSRYIDDVLYQFLDTENYQLKIPKDKSRTVESLTKDFDNTLKQCLSGVRYRYEELITKAYGIPEDMFKMILENASEEDVKEFEDEMLKFELDDTINVLIDSVNEDREKLRRAKVASGIPLEKIRVYTHEDHADEVAVEVLRSIGIKPDGLNSFLTRNSKCANNSSEPYYGPLDSEHHSGCWRAYRNNKYYQFLSQ